MMKEITFDIAFDRLIGFEAGYVNDPKDPGGETNWGISKRSYPNEDIRNLTREGAKQIYLRDFWNKTKNLYDSVRFQLFDFGVNSGLTTAFSILQREIGVAPDGQWGKISSLVASKYSEADLLMLLIAGRADYFTRLGNWPTAGRGWIRKRIAENLRYAAKDTDDDPMVVHAEAIAKIKGEL